MLGKFFMLLWSSADFFQSKLFQIILSGTPSEYQNVWTKIRTDILSVLIWVQTVCKDHQQTTKVAAGRQRADGLLDDFFVFEQEVTKRGKIKYNGIS